MPPIFFGLSVLLLTVCGRGMVPPSLQGEPDRRAQDYVLIVTGGEILQGVYSDGHTQFVTRTLGPLGCRCVASLSVGDTRKDLLDALTFAVAHAPLVIVTGGLGPTDDDITRQVLSEFTGIALKENPQVLASLERRFSVEPGQLPSNVKRQGGVPENGGFLPNPNGTAVGLVFEKNNRVITALPGPPDELQPMVVEQLVPYLAGRFGIRSIGTKLQMRFVGIGESRIDQTIHSHLDIPDDLIISSLFESGRVDLTFALPGDTPEDRKRLEDLEGQLLRYLGEYMYADDGSTLEESVIHLATARGISLGIAEVGSGGLISAALSEVDASARALSGTLVAGSAARQAEIMGIAPATLRSQPSRTEESARRLALEAARYFQAGWGLGVSEPDEPGNGRTSIWVAVGPASGTITARQLFLRGRGRSQRSRLVTDALDFLRRALLASPEPENR